MNIERQKQINKQLKEIKVELEREDLTPNEEDELLAKYRKIRDECKKEWRIPMTVKELIKELLEMDMNKKIVVFDAQDGWSSDMHVVNQDEQILLSVR